MGKVIQLRELPAKELGFVMTGLQDGTIKGAVVCFQMTDGSFVSGTFDGMATKTSYLEKIGMLQTAMMDLYARAQVEP